MTFASGAFFFIASMKKGASRLSKRMVVEFGSRKKTLSSAMAEVAALARMAAARMPRARCLMLVSSRVWMRRPGRCRHKYPIESGRPRQIVASSESDLHCAAGADRLQCAIREAQGLSPVARCGGHRRSVLQCLEEGFEFVAICVRVALEKEIQQRRPGFRFARGIAPHGARPEVVVEQHALGAEDFESLVIAVDGFAAAVDVALLARGGLQDHHHGVEVGELLHHCGVYDPAGLGIDLDRLLAEKEARHVEVMDRHVAEDAARMSDIVARRQARVAAGDDDLTHLANLARVDGPA